MFLELPWSHITVFWPGLIALGFFIGMLSGIFGTGGGFLLTPLLKYVFGVPFEVAVGSSLSAISISSITGTYNHYKLGHVFVNLGLLFLCGSLPGVEVGTRLLGVVKTTATQIPGFYGIELMDAIIGSCFVVLLSSSSFLMFREIKRYSISESNNGCGALVRNLATYRLQFFFKPFFTFKQIDRDANTDRINIIALVGTGFMVGILSGFLGVGGGFIMTPLLICVFGLPAIIAIGTGLSQLMITAAMGTILHYVRGNVDFVLAGFIVLGSIFGTKIGSSLTPRFRGKKIRLYFAWFLVISAIFILIQMIIS